MKIPLIVHARPHTNPSPVVYLLPGSWEIESNHKTSHLVLHLSPEISVDVTDGMTVEGGCQARIDIKTPGSESHISVYAKRIS